MKIAAYYGRNSTPGQKEDKTIESQVAEIETRVKDDRNIIGKNLRFEDEAWSGESLDRPALDALRDAVKAKSFEILYLYDLGRLSRNFLNQLILKKEIMDAGIQIISLHDINGETQEALLAQNVMGLFHDYERIKIAERFRRGKLYKAKHHVLFGWVAPYGYKYIKGDSKNNINGKFEIVKEEAEVIRQVFNWIGIEGLTIRRVIKRLFEKKMLPRKSKNGYWATSTLSKRLRDTTYTGTTYYNKTVSVIPENPYKNEKYKRIKKSSRKIKPREEWLSINDVPPIIEPALFEAVKKQLILNDCFAMRNQKNKYLLSGLNYCACGKTRAGEGNSKNGHIYYRCTDRVHRFPLPRQCHLKGVNATILDATVWNELFKLLTSRKLIEDKLEIWQKLSNVTQDDADFLKKELKKQLDQLEDEEKTYIEDRGAHVISREQLQDQLNKLKPKKAQIMAKLGNCSTDISTSQQLQPLIIPDLDQYCEKMKFILKDRDFEKKLPIVRKAITKVITDGTIAKIQGNIPLQIPENTQEYVGSKTEYRYRRTSQRRKINPF